MKWNIMKESKPAPSQDILCCDRKGWIAPCEYNQSIDLLVVYGGSECYPLDYFDYWMPFPEPPYSEKQPELREDAPRKVTLEAN